MARVNKVGYRPQADTMAIDNHKKRVTPAKWIAVLGLAGFAHAVQAAPVLNFGESLAGLQQAYADRRVHILQIGDSHTAGDYFTEQLRKRLQAEVGDGGVGFSLPMAVSGQRTARHGHDGSGWVLSNSRTDGSGDYPLGGMYATPLNRYGELIITSQYYAGDTQTMRLKVKGNAGQQLSLADARGTRTLTLPRSGWQTLVDTIRFPVRITSTDGVMVGGMWLGREQGGQVSAMGINGATQTYWQRWRPALAEDLRDADADLVILAYGTNEAFSSDPSGQAAAIDQAIAQIRQGLPQASILLINAPESLASTSGSCGTRAVNLEPVRATIRQAAERHRTLYWDWQEAMGGECSMKRWMAQGWAARDGVHFTRAGYENAANDLYTNLKLTINTGAGVNTGTMGGGAGTMNAQRFSLPIAGGVTGAYGVDATAPRLQNGTPSINTPSATYPVPTYRTPNNPQIARICNAQGQCVMTNTR